jgi:predicted GNAT family N-acyltransferase
MITVRLAESNADVEQCIRLRWTVFVEEQGVPPSLEIDAHDRRDAVHALALKDSVPCGAGRFVFVEAGVAKIGRMAVIDDVRGQGVGRKLLELLEAEARRRGASRFTLGAQVHAQRFYETFGYKAQGPVFDDAGIPHVRMDKPATPA